MFVTWIGVRAYELNKSNHHQQKGNGKLFIWKLKDTTYLTIYLNCCKKLLDGEKSFHFKLLFWGKHALQLSSMTHYIWTEHISVQNRSEEHLII